MKGATSALSAISNIFKQVTQHVYDFMEHIKRLKNVLASLKRLFECKPDSHWLQSNITIIACELRALQDKLCNYKFNKDATSWISKGIE